MQADIGTGETHGAKEGRPALRVVGAGTRVVIADGDQARRAGLLDDLTQTMPEVTTFLEASTIAELLEQAKGSRMVILGGPLDELPASAIIRVIAQRFPDLHVVNMEAAGRRDL
jgi:DNA-binding NtrC family response regulator